MDDAEHEESEFCWCDPVQIFGDDESGVWVHDYGNGEKPPSDVVASAIAAYIASEE